MLERNEMLEPAIDEVVEDAWRGEPDRALRRAALAVLARTDGRHWDDVVQLITDPSRPGALRLDALYRLTPRPLLAENDVRTFETWIPVLAAWSEREPTIRDNEPMADARNGPNVTFVDVPTRDRVAALAQAVDRATGLESAILHDWAVRLSESIEK